jgi:hypothetical protein
MERHLGCIFCSLADPGSALPGTRRASCPQLLAPFIHGALSNAAGENAYHQRETAEETEDEETQIQEIDEEDQELEEAA